MRSLKMNYGGAGKVSVSFDEEVSGIVGVAQRAATAVMTQSGSNKFLQDIGTDVVRNLLGFGAFDFAAIQHTLNFGSLKALADVKLYENDREDSESINNIQMTLISVESNTADVAVSVSNAAGGFTKVITEVA